MKNNNSINSPTIQELLRSREFRAAVKRYREEEKRKARERARAYRNKNSKKYSQRNREYSRRYYQQNRERILRKRRIKARNEKR